MTNKEERKALLSLIYAPSKIAAQNASVKRAASKAFASVNKTSKAPLWTKEKKSISRLQIVNAMRPLMKIEKAKWEEQERLNHEFETRPYPERTGERTELRISLETGDVLAYNLIRTAELKNVKLQIETGRHTTKEVETQVYAPKLRRKAYKPIMTYVPMQKQKAKEKMLPTVCTIITSLCYQITVQACKKVFEKSGTPFAERLYNDARYLARKNHFAQLAILDKTGITTVKEHNFKMVQNGKRRFKMRVKPYKTQHKTEAYKEAEKGLDAFGTNLKAEDIFLEAFTAYLMLYNAHIINSYRDIYDMQYLAFAAAHRYIDSEKRGVLITSIDNDSAPEVADSNSDTKKVEAAILLNQIRRYIKSQTAPKKQTLALQVFDLLFIQEYNALQVSEVLDVPKSTVYRIKDKLLYLSNAFLNEQNA